MATTPRDWSEGDQAELRSLRHHLDKNTVGRMRELEHVAESAAHYLNTAKAPFPDRRAMDDALGILVLALARAGWNV